MTLSELCGRATQIGSYWCDGSFGEPVGEMNGMIHRRNLKKVADLLNEAGRSASQFEAEAEKATSPKWVSQNLDYFFQCCCELGLL